MMIFLKLFFQRCYYLSVREAIGWEISAYKSKKENRKIGKSMTKILASKPVVRVKKADYDLIDIDDSGAIVH